MPTTDPSPPTPALYALLVGIDDYASPAVPDLRGCVNDVDAVAQLLESRYGVPGENITRLADGEATNAGIREAFEAHLVGAAQAWDAAGRPEPSPAFLFHYSGHGSQALDPTGTEPDGLDETLVTHDSRTEGVFDLKDWELAALVAQLTAVTDNVTIVLDCCHSGSGTRAIGAGLAQVRRCPPDLRPQPGGRPTEEATRGVSTPSDWIDSGQHVLIAGCRDRQESNEMAVEEGGESRRHGAMTYFMVTALGAMPADRPMTYRELHETVRGQVNARFPNQVPQCEGDRDREVFGGARPDREPLLAVAGHEGDRVIVDGGIAHGLTVGSALTAYPPGTRAVADDTVALAALEVVEVGPTQCRCVAGDDVADVTGVVPVGAQVAITHLHYGDMHQKVALDIADAGLADAVRSRLEDDGADPDVTGVVKIVSLEAAADLRLGVDGGRLEIQDPTGAPLVAPFAPSDLDGLARDVGHIARYRNAMGLRNAADRSGLAGTVTLEISTLRMDEGGNVVVGDDREPALEPLPTSDGGELELTEGDRVVFRVTNTGTRPVYVSLLDFAPSWAVWPLYPAMAGAQEALAPGRTVTLGRSSHPGEQFPVSLPEGMPEGRDTLKVIATLEPADFSVLGMDRLRTPFETRSLAGVRGEGSALDALLRLAGAGDGTRDFRPGAVQAPDDWTTVERQVMTVRAADASAKPLEGGRAVEAGYGLTVEAPSAFRGQVRLLTAEQSVRAIGDATDLQPPPGLAPFGETFEPLALGTPASRAAKDTGALPSEGAVIEVEYDTGGWAHVTDESPLRLGLPESVPGDDGVMALAYDGSLYYPVGRLGDDRATVDVGWLPEPPPPGEDAALRSKRSLKNVVRLFLFKVADMPTPSLGLHNARYVPEANLAEDPAADGERVVPVKGGEVRYRTVRPGELAAGQRVVLFVHGFTADTQYMVSGIAERFRRTGADYDHYLTYDYETAHTSIADNGKQLADALREAGLGPDDGVRLDIVSHSMGTQVSRSMVREHGGDAFTDRVIQAGPPNDGTALARLKRPIVWLVTLGLNSAGPSPPALAAGWAVKKLSDNLAGVDDLAPGSDFYARLNDPSLPDNVPFHVLIGRNELREEEQTAWARVAGRLGEGADAVLDMVFDSQNDLVISVASARDPERYYPADRFEVAEVTCDHFGYFSTLESRGKLYEMLGIDA